MRSTVFEGINGHDVISARTNSSGTTVITRPRRRYLPPVTVSGALLASASILLAALAVTMGAVSWHAQYTFILAAKHQHLASALEALGLDAGAVVFSVLGIALARLGRRAVIERSLVCLCAAGSLVMNLLGAQLGSPRSVAVFVMPPVLFALTSDRLTSVIRRSALGPVDDEDAQRSAWRIAGLAALYVLRFCLAPPSTATGMRRMVLDAAPLPGPAALPAPEPAEDLKLRPARARVAPGRDGTQTGRFLALARERHNLAALPLSDVSAIATALAPEANLHPSTARRELLRHVRALQTGSTS